MKVTASLSWYGLVLGTMARFRMGHPILHESLPRGGGAFGRRGFGFVGDFFGGDFLGGDFLGGDFFGGDFLTAGFFGGDFLGAASTTACSDSRTTTTSSTNSDLIAADLWVPVCVWAASVSALLSLREKWFSGVEVPDLEQETELASCYCRWMTQEDLGRGRHRKTWAEAESCRSLLVRGSATIFQH